MKFSMLVASLCAFAALLTLNGCDPSAGSGSASATGKPCVIQFRRDALGAAADLPVGPKTTNINGAETSISCEYKSSMGDWVVVSESGHDVWIPKSVILMIEFQK